MLRNKITDIGFGVYLLAAAAALILFFVSIGFEPQDDAPEAFPDAWFRDAEMTEKADLRHPDTGGAGCVFYAAVPGDIQKGDCLWFRVKNAFITVRVGGERRAEIDSGRAAALYGKTPGTDWVCVPLEAADAADLISIEFVPAYGDNSAHIDDVSIGNTLSALRHTLSGTIFGAIMCILLMFTAVAMIVTSLVFTKKIKNTSKELLYLGLSAFFAGLWSLSELRVLQLFTDKTAGMFHNLTCMSLMLFTIPLIYYHKAILDKKCRYIAPAVSAVSLLNITVCSALHFSGIADFHETLPFTHITIGLGAATVVYANYLRLFGSAAVSKRDIPPAVCMVLVAVASLVDMARYRRAPSCDSGYFVRIAIFLFMCALGVRSLSAAVESMRKGIKAAIISRLAYEDGLTGLGNRTAYSERLEKISKIKNKETTIFAFDINNLKYVNDNIGHQAGDELIKAGADLIATTFSKVGRCYRTGGDEFACLAAGALDTQLYSDEFYGNMRTFNQKGTLGYPLIIALGSEICSGGDITSAIDAADRKMYAKKAELKQGENGRYDRKA